MVMVCCSAYHLQVNPFATFSQIYNTLILLQLRRSTHVEVVGYAADLTLQLCVHLSAKWDRVGEGVWVELRHGSWEKKKQITSGIWGFWKKRNMWQQVRIKHYEVLIWNLRRKSAKCLVPFFSTWFNGRWWVLLPEIFTGLRITMASKVNKTDLLLTDMWGQDQ